MQPVARAALAWVCGFMMGKDTASPLHAHEYVESFIEHDGVRRPDQPVRVRPSDTTVTAAEIKDQALATELRASATRRRWIAPPHLEQYIPNRADYQRVWAEVKAS